jgi:ABC-2 type transport system ATP-binding protein
MKLFVAKNVVKEYSGYLALDNVSVELNEGCIFGLLGPNGAGKTTLIRIINQITAPDSGELLFKDRPLCAADTAFIGYLPEERGLYKKMKVGEQALYLAQLKGMSRHDALKGLKYWFEKFEMRAWWDKKVEELSKGMAQKVQFITTILHNPELLIFDEPFSGFDPINAQLMKDEILNLQKQGSTIIFSTHNMASVEELCSDIALINKGKVILSGNVNDIRRSYRSGLYEINFEGDSNKLIEALGTNFSIVKQSSQHERINARIQQNTDFTSNELLSRAIGAVQIHSFNEVIPSMNDVFIKAVGSDASINANSILTE